MTLRTPRRRISPRTKRRYRAIKDFLRRALGSSSQPDIKINSSIAINVTDLKHKIVGLEQQLSEVNKHCRNLVCLESSSQKDSQTLVSNADRHDLSSLKEQTEISSTKHVHGAETKLLYKTSESHYRKSEDSDSFGKEYNDTKGKDIRAPGDMAAHGYYRESKIKKKKSKLDNRLNVQDSSDLNLRKHKTRSVYENFVSSYSTSYHSLVDPRSGRRKRSVHPDHGYEDQHLTQQLEYVEPIRAEKKIKNRKENTSRRNSPIRSPEYQESRHRNKSKINAPRKLDQDFIADIIKRQYQPMRMFGHRESELSQFSAPVCRDQEFPIRENIQEGSELCSCCIDGHKKSRYEYEHDLSDMRSICDTRLYSSKRHARHRHNRKNADIYNDSTQYDLVPVKEKSSPKSRRKFAAESMVPYGYYKEVPPSPRTLRPRLNLKAQYYTELEDYMHYRKQRDCSPKRSRKHQERIYHYNAKESSHAMDHKGKPKTKSSKNVLSVNNIQQDVGTMSSLQSPTFNSEPMDASNDSALNKTQETDSSTDKTDKALSEIKDILQCFLQEIKKETTVSQCDNSDITKPGEKCLNEFRQESTKLTGTVMQNSGHSVNNYSLPQCSLPPPFMPPFANPCCYPVLPVCPMNCVQNGYMFPTPSYTCASCANHVKEDVYQKKSSNETANNVKNNETDELIKEIYKFVAQSPNSSRKKDFHEKPGSGPEKVEDNKILTSRSAGGSSKLTKHDAQVGTQKIKCYSKSCEAIGSRFLSDTSYSRTNPSYSDTILERLSLEATATGSESEISSESTTVKKSKKNRFARVLRSIGLFKKKKDVIEELSESESTMEVEVKAKKPPFHQEVMNYMVHQQEYFNRPPHQSTPYAQKTDCPHSYGCHAGCQEHLNNVNMMHASYDPYHQQINQDQGAAAAYRPNPHLPSAPPYPHPYEGHNHNQPQVPLCLKEIEVKSIGTQSERKMTFFKKLTKKAQGPKYAVAQKHDPQKNCSTQTGKETKINTRPPLFNWKNLQAKVNQLDNPPTFSYKTQKQLAEGDIKMRNAMLKKLFYKRNPFSPRNLIVRTILGKDKSSYGEPPMMYRPRMFF